MLTFIGMIAASRRSELSALLALPALAILVGALALFQWAAHSIRGKFFSYIGSRDTPQFVFQEGPFAYVRHPFYTSYMLTHLAVALAYLGWLTSAIALASFVVLWRAAAFEEGKFASSPNAAEYRAYVSRTGRFVPKFQASKLLA